MVEGYCGGGGDEFGGGYLEEVGGCVAGEHLDVGLVDVGEDVHGADHVEGLTGIEEEAEGDGA